MSKPPSDLEPSELWASITSLPRPHRVVEFPRTKDDGTPMGEMAMWVLRQEEQMAASAAATAVAKALMKDLAKDSEARIGYEEVYRNALSCEVLMRACREKDNLSRPFFPSAASIRRELTMDEVGVLVNSYFRVQDELGPIYADLSAEEEEAWIELLAKGGSRIPLASLSPGAVNQLLTSMASRLRSSSTDTSSPGSQPEDETPHDEPSSA